MIKTITLLLALSCGSSAFAAPRIADYEQYLPKWALARKKAPKSDVTIQNNRIVINFDDKNLTFELPLRPDLVQYAGDKIKPFMLDENEAAVLEFFEKENSPAEQKAIAEMSPLKRNQYIKDQMHKRIALFAQKEILEKRMAKHEEEMNLISKKIHGAYQEYDSMDFEEKARVNEMRRRVLKGLSRFLSSHFQTGVYRVGEDSLDSFVEAGPGGLPVPSLKEKALLKILNAFNTQLFYLGRRILSTNEYGWVALGAPVMMIPKIGHMYVVSLHVGYNVGDDKLYVRVAGSLQKGSSVVGPTVGLFLAPLGFYAATMDTAQKTQTLEGISSYNPPGIPAMAMVGKEMTIGSMLLPYIPVGPWVLPTTVVPYPLSEAFFFTSTGKMKMRALGSFAVKKLKILKQGQGVKVYEEIGPMPATLREKIAKGVEGMKAFWTKKNCEVALSPLEQQKMQAVNSR